MNICNENHHPIYKVTYSGSPGSNYYPEWLVCQKCFNNLEGFSTSRILSINKLDQDDQFEQSHC